MTIDLESTQKTIESYMVAYHKLIEICPHLEASTNDFNGRTVLPCSYYPSFYASFDFPRLATGFYVHAEDLFDFGRPKLINKGWDIWESRFITISLFLSIPFTIYRREPGRTESIDEDGELIPAVPSEIKKWSTESIKLTTDNWGYKRYGLKDWKAKYDEIIGLMRTNKNKLDSDYRKRIEEIDKQVDKWLTAINSFKVTL